MYTRLSKKEVIEILGDYENDSINIGYSIYIKLSGDTNTYCWMENLAKLLQIPQLLIKKSVRDGFLSKGYDLPLIGPEFEK